MKRKQYRIWRVMSGGLLTLLLMASACPSLLATAAPGYYYGKITVVDEPDTFSTENVTYYIGEEAAPASELVWVDNGHTGKALKLSGNGEFLRLGYTAAVAKEFTFSGWINWQGAAGDNGLTGQRLFTIARSTDNFLTFSPYMRDESQTAEGGFLNGVYLGYQYGGADGKVVSMFNPTSDAVSYALPCNEWHHIAVVSDGRTYKLYIDGVRWFEEQILTTVAELRAYSVDIGSGEWGDPTLNALLDDVTLYNSAFSESRIAELAHGEGEDETGSTTAYIPTKPSATTTETPTVATEPVTTTTRATLGATLWGIPLWGIYTIIGIVVVYVALVVLLNIQKKREKQDGGKGKGGGENG